MIIRALPFYTVNAILDAVFLLAYESRWSRIEGEEAVYYYYHCDDDINENDRIEQEEKI